MIPANEHPCPMCWQRFVPVWRPLCARCYAMTPKGFRDDYSYAYRARAVNPVRWQEKFAEGRQWYLGRNLKEEEGGQ